MCGVREQSVGPQMSPTDAMACASMAMGLLLLHVWTCVRMQVLGRVCGGKQDCKQSCAVTRANIAPAMVQKADIGHNLPHHRISFAALLI